MDAAHKFLNKTALFLATALLTAVPALAQSQLIVSSTTVGLNDNQAKSVQVTASGSTALSYTLSGVPFWLSVFSSNGFTTPDTLFIQLSNTNCGSCTATVTLTPAGGGTAVPITVAYTPGGNGGGGSGTITASQTTLNFSGAAGQSAPTQNVSLSSTSAVTVIGISSDQTTWLSAAITAGSFTISSNNPATLTVSANAFSLNAGTYTGHITITPNAGTATVITVNFVVGGSGGGSTGTIVANQSSLTFNAVAGQVSASQNLTLSNPSSSPVGVTLTAPDATWLTASVVTGTPSSITSSTPLTVQLIANAASLTNGTYNGHLTITPTIGNPTVLPVTLIVGTGSGGGSSGTVVASSTSLSFFANSGQIAASQNVTLTSSTAVSFSVSSDVTWLTSQNISGGTNIGPSNSAILQISASAVNLNNGTYTGHITISPTSGTATVILVTFTVGTGGGGGNQGTITASQTSFQLQYPNTGNPPSVVIGTSNASVTTYNVDVASAQNWLRFSVNNVQNGHYTNVQFGTYTINVDQGVAATLGTGTYTGTLTLSNPNNSNDTTVITVTLIVNGGGGGGTGGGISASQGTLNFTASPGGAPQQQNFTIAAPSGATVQLNATSFNGGFFSLSSATTPGCGGTPNNSLSCTLVGSQTFTVTVNPGNLNNLGTYSAQLQFQSGTSAPVNVFVVMTLTSPVNTLTAGAQSLTFSAATGGVAQTQGLAVSVPGQALVQVSVTSFNGNFFSVSSNSCSNITPSSNTVCSFNGNQTLYVTVNPSALNAAGTYNGIITLQSGGSTISVPVNLTLTTGGGGGTTATIAAPPSLNFAYQTSSTAIVPQQVITIAPPGTFSVSGSVSTTQQWLSVSPVGNSGPGYAIVSVSPQGLAAGTYQGTVSIISAGGSMNIPVTLTVTSGVVVEATPATIYFNYQGGAASTQQPLTLVASDNSATPVTASTTTSWISIGAASSTTTPATFPLTVNPSTLCNGLNVGSIAISAPNAVNSGFTIPVVVLVSGSTATTGCSGGGGTSPLSVTGTSLTYTYQPGGTTPAGQSITVTSANGTAGVSFSYSLTGNLPVTATVNGTAIQSGQTLTTPATITFTPTVSGLTPGSTYSDTVTLAPVGGGTSVPITLSLTVSNTPVVSAPSTPLTFTFNAGSAAPSSQTIQVSGGSGLTFSATASSSGNWLSVSPTTGTTPQTLTVSVNPTGLAANTYNGTIVVAGTGSAGGSTTIPVTLTVTAPLPTITSLGSAASYLGGSISPGEIITIFGTSIGPTPGVSLALDSTGKVATTLAGVQVLINGFLSPMVFASNTQVSAVVPYELCANSCGAGTIAQVVVKFLGQSSNGIPTPVASTTTGVFTANASGSGPAAILNANLSANSPSNPANKGDVVAIYLTGEGQTSPAGVTGKVTTVASTGPLTPVPLLPVAVLIDGQPASISFAGEAPGLVSGAMQLNVQIPAGARSGNLPLVVTIGSVSSQAGVTVSVK